MAAIEQTIYAYLSGLTTMTDQVSTRIYPRGAPMRAEDDRPYITFRIADEDRPARNQSDPGGLVSSSIDFDVIANDEVTAQSVTDALRNCLDGYQEDTDMGGVADVQRVNYTGRSDAYIGPQDGDEFGTWTNSLSYDFWVVESVPSFPAS